MNNQFQDSFTNGMAVQNQDSYFNDMTAQDQDPIFNDMTAQGQDSFFNNMAVQSQDSFFNDMTAQDQRSYFNMTVQGQDSFNGMTVQDENSYFNTMTAQAQGPFFDDMTAQGQAAINANARAAQGYQNTMFPMVQNVGFNPNAQQAPGIMYPGQYISNPTMDPSIMYPSQYMGNAMMNQGVMYPGQHMGNAMMAQSQSNISYSGARPAADHRVPLGVIPDGANRRAAPSGPTKARKGKVPMDNGQQGVKRPAETDSEGAAPKRRAKESSSKSTPINSNGVNSNGPAAIANGSTTQDFTANAFGTSASVSGQGLVNDDLGTNPSADVQSASEASPLGSNSPVPGEGLTTNPLETNTWVPNQNTQSAVAVNSPAAFDAAATQPPLASASANGQGAQQPGPSIPAPEPPDPPITRPHGKYSEVEKEARRKEIVRIWERFQSDHDMVELCSKRPVLAEREKYRDYLERCLETEKTATRTAFRHYLTAGLPALARGQPVTEPAGFDGNVNAAVKAANTVRQADGGLPQVAPHASDELIAAKIEEQMAKLETMLPAGIQFGPVEYAKARPQELTLAVLPAPDMPGGTTGPRKRTCHIVRGDGNRVYGGHRGGDFVFTYRGRREYANDSPLRFDYDGQVPRTSDEYMHRLNLLAPRAWDIMRAILGFDPYTSMALTPEHLPGAVGIEAVFEEGPGSIRQQWKARFSLNGAAPTEFRLAMNDAICAIDVMREFGWLGWNLREKRGVTLPRYYKLVMDMIQVLTGLRDNNLRMSYENSQEETARALAFSVGEFGDRVVVCLESVVQKLFTAHNNPEDPLLHIREPVDVLELAKNALATSAAEVYKEHHDSLVEQFTHPDNNAPFAQPDQDDEVYLVQQDDDDAPVQLPALEDVAGYFQRIVDDDPEPPDPDPQAQDADVSLLEQFNADLEFQDLSIAAPENDEDLNDFVNFLIDDTLAAQVPEDPVRPAEEYDAEPTAEPDEDWRSLVNWDDENQDAEVPAEPQLNEPAPDNTGNPTDQDDDLNHPALQALLRDLVPFDLTF